VPGTGPSAPPFAGLPTKTIVGVGVYVAIPDKSFVGRIYQQGATHEFAIHATLERREFRTSGKKRNIAVLFVANRAQCVPVDGYLFEIRIVDKNNLICSSPLNFLPSAEGRGGNDRKRQ
jgi:hypothetical protein